MSGRGVLFAITDDDVRALLACEDDDEVVEYVSETIEERWEAPYVGEVDKAWWALHGSLARGFDDVPPATPEAKCIYGSRELGSGEDDIVALTPADEVAEVAAALDAIDRDELRRRYDAMDPDGYAPYEASDEDFASTWDWFNVARGLWRRAADDGRAVLFSAAR